MKDAIVFVISHPDDEMISCGGFLISFANSDKHDIYCILVTDNYKDKVLSNYRYNVFSSIMKELNIKYLNLGNTAYSFKHSDLPNLYEELNISLGFDYTNYNRVFVITHHPNDFNIDHSEVSKSTILSFRSIPSSIFFIDTYSSEPIYSFKANYQFYFDKDIFNKKVHYIDLYLAISNSHSVVYDRNRISSFDLLNKSNITYPDKPYTEKFEVYRLT